MRSERSDEDLMRAIQRGESEACTELMDRYDRPIRQLAASILPDQALFDPDDIVSVTFIQAWEYANTYRPSRGAVSTWLTRIAVNCCRRVARGERCRERILTTSPLLEQNPWPPLALAMEKEDDPEADPNFQPLLPISPSAESEYLARVDAEERRQMVRQWLGWLTGAEREAMVLWGLKGLTYQEAAEVLGLPVGTVRKRVERGLERIQRRLAEPTPVVVARREVRE